MSQIGTSKTEVRFMQKGEDEIEGIHQKYWSLTSYTEKSSCPQLDMKTHIWSETNLKTCREKSCILMNFYRKYSI